MRPLSFRNETAVAAVLLPCVIVTVTRQCAGCAATVRDRQSVVLTHHIPIESDECLSRNSGASRLYTVCAVANRTRESILDMPIVLCPVCARGNVVEVVALGTESVGRGGGRV